MVGDVVPVGAAGAGLEAGREIGVAHPERGQVWSQRADVLEAQRRSELEPVRRAPRARERRDGLLEQGVEVRHGGAGIMARPGAGALSIRGSHRCVSVSLG